jgi:hypothetical protein
MIDDSRARNIFRKVALVLLSTLLLVYLTDLVFGLLSLKGVEAGTLGSADAYEKIYYRSTWAGIIFVCTSLVWLRILPSAAIVLACAICAEVGAFTLFSVTTGKRFNPSSSLIGERFILHPLLQGIPRPGRFAQYTHTETNLRYTVNDQKDADATTIYIYGGSTTYDLGVDDENTWSSHLSKLLGSRFVIENHGVPGYSTVEHIVQTAFDFRSRRPKCAIFYVGWNDLRNSNIKGLRADYSNFHLLKQPGNLAIDPTRSWTSPIKQRSLFLSMISNLGARQIELNGDHLHEYDARLSKIYKDNVALIASIASHFGVTPIFVPQVLNYEKFTRNIAYSKRQWMPFLFESDVQRLMSEMNGDLANAANERGSQYLDEVLRTQWANADFVDSGHFSPRGSHRFAKAISERVIAACS